MKKKTVIICISVFLFVLLGIITFIMAKNSKNIKQYDEKKIDSEIKQIDDQILEIFNQFDSKNIEEINWNNIKTDMNRLYTAWNSIIIDFSLLNIDNYYLKDFGKKMDETMMTIQNKEINKVETNLSDLYGLLVQYINAYDSNEILKNNIITKYYLIKAYTFIWNNNWTLVNENINNAVTNFYQNMNMIEVSESQKFNLNKSYIAINELKNTLAYKNKELFYIKYKIAMEEIKKIK